MMPDRDPGAGQPPCRPGEPADLRHEYAQAAAALAVLRARLAEIEGCCGGRPPVGYCAVCGCALFPQDRPAADAGGDVVCGREGVTADFAAPCFWRPSRPGTP